MDSKLTASLDQRLTWMYSRRLKVNRRRRQPGDAVTFFDNIFVLSLREGYRTNRIMVVVWARSWLKNSTYSAFRHDISVDKPQICTVRTPNMSIVLLFMYIIESNIRPVDLLSITDLCQDDDTVPAQLSTVIPPSSSQASNRTSQKRRRNVVVSTVQLSVSRNRGIASNEWENKGQCRWNKKISCEQVGWMRRVCYSRLFGCVRLGPYVALRCKPAWEPTQPTCLPTTGRVHSTTGMLSGG